MGKLSSVRAFHVVYDRMTASYFPALAVFEVGKELPSHAKASRSLLQFTGIDLLLVHSIAGGVGSVEPGRHVLASTACAVAVCVPVRNGYRLLRELDQESYFSLRHYRPIISGRRHRVATLG
jgi:hypothetical protein